MYQPVCSAPAELIMPGAIVKHHDDYYHVDSVRTEASDNSISGMLSYLDVTALTHNHANPAISLGRDPSFMWTIYIQK